MGIKKTYNVPIEEYGITNKQLSKPYETGDYEIAINNIKGINRAIEYAGENNYDKIKFPNGYYCTCYSNIGEDTEKSIIIDQDNLVVDFGGATFKVIYDSENRSPYDTSEEEIYSFGGYFLRMRNCKNSVIKNATIIGDKMDRSFIEQAEKAVEWTYGLAIGGGGQNLVCENIDVSMFMGDGLTCSSGNNNIIKVGYQMGWTQSKINDDKEIEVSDEYCLSDFIQVNPSTNYWLHGYGYTQGLTSLTNKQYTTIYYDENKNYIDENNNCCVLRSSLTPSNCFYMRLQVQENSIDSDGWQMSLKDGLYGEKVYFKSNYIHHNHRGGMSIGVNDLFIYNNYFYNNGASYDYEHDLPGFEQENGALFMTRYHINMEDSQGWNTNIFDNKFEGGRLGIAARGRNYLIKNNEFENDEISIILYKMYNAIVEENKNCSFDTYAYNTDSIELRDWIIRNNEFTTFSIKGDSPVSSLENNIILSKFTSATKINNIDENIFKLEEDVGYANICTFNDLTFNNCIFEKEDYTIKNMIIASGCVFNNCKFENEKIVIKNNTFNGGTIKDCSFRMNEDCTNSFNDVEIYHNEEKVNNNYSSIENSALFDLQGSKAVNLSLSNCNISSSSSHSLIGNSHSMGVLTIEECNIERFTNNKLGFESFIGVWNFENNTITSEYEYSVSTPTDAICTIKNNEFVNVTITTKETDIIE